jgi:ABC-2 type transport system permease protein
MRAHNVMLVFRKDWREIRRNWHIILPIVSVPLLISVLLPILIIVLPDASSASTMPLDNSVAMIRSLPSNVREQLAGMTPTQVVTYVMSLYFFAPFFLIIPVMASSVVAADSFAGEKERRTIEALLATPISDSELFLGKVLISFVLSMIATIASFATYSIIVDTFSYATFGGRLLFPNVAWTMLIFGVAPTIALADIGLTVMISTRVKGFREAQQISALLLLPMLALTFGQISGAIIFGPIIIGSLIIILALCDIAVFYVGVRLFKREEILSRLT